MQKDISRSIDPARVNLFGGPDDHLYLPGINRLWAGI
jgi:hypothetical protein